MVVSKIAAEVTANQKFMQIMAGLLASERDAGEPDEKSRLQERYYSKVRTLGCDDVITGAKCLICEVSDDRSDRYDEQAK